MISKSVGRDWPCFARTFHREIQVSTTYLESVGLEDVEFAHGTGSLLQKPRIDAGLVKDVLTRQNADDLAHQERVDADRARVSLRVNLLETHGKEMSVVFCECLVSV